MISARRIALVAPLALALCWAAGAGCDPKPKPGPGPKPLPPPPSPPPSSTPGLAEHNDERARRGLAPYTWEATLARIAADQAAHCARTGQLTHIGPGGSTVGDRATAAGYRWSRLGENAVYGPDPVGRWLDSPGHRANVLGEYREMGMAWADGGGKRWWVACYGTPR